MPVRELIEFPLIEGVDTKTDDKMVAPAKLLKCENGVFTRGGGVKKRNGYAQLSQKIAASPVVTAPDFKPSDLGVNLVLWAKRSTGLFQDAAMTTPAAAGDPVNGWADQSGSGNHLTNAASNAVRSAGVVPDGTDAVVWGGLFGELHNLAFSLAQPFSVFIVWQGDSESGGANVFDGVGSGVNRAMIRELGGNLVSYAGAVLAGSAIAYPTPWMAVAAVFNGAASKLYRNGTLEASGDAGAETLTGFRIAEGFDGEMLGKIAEVFVATVDQTDPDFPNALTYCNKIAGLP